MFLGKDGFIWWIGVVEDIEDEFLLGRVKVRIFGYHPDFDSGKLPTQDLPWAVVTMPPNIPNAYGRLELGDWVFGFFLDASETNEPAIVSYIPGIPDPAAKNFGRYKKPRRSFYNTTASTANSHSITTRSGHFLEFVDTPSLESIRLTHKNRNSIAINANNTIIINHTKGPRITLDDSGVTGQLRMEVSNTIANTSTVSTMNCNALSMIACSNGTINIQRGNSTIRMLQNGNVEIVANNIILNTGNTGDVNLTGKGGSYSISQKFLDLDRINASQNTVFLDLYRINASQNTEIEIAKLLPIPPPPPEPE